MRLQLAPINFTTRILYFYPCVLCLCLQLAPIKLSRYSEDLLFYLYYTNGGDILQLAAAAEL